MIQESAIKTSAGRDAHSGSGTVSRLTEVDVLRGLAAVAVVVFHYAGYCQRYFADFPFTLHAGRYGVQLFFVISGFFIYRTLERSGNAKEFIFLRFSRIYPAYWATLLMLLFFEIIQSGANAWFGGYLVNATMWQSFVGFPNVDDVYWTLGVEMSFYILMAILLASRAINYAKVVVLIWLGMANIWFVLHGGPPENMTVIDQFARILTCAPFFIAGMMFYLIKKSPAQFLVHSTIVIFLCVVTAWATGGTEMGIVSLVVFTLMGLALLGKLGFLVSRVTLWLGAISYSLYLVHRNLGYMALAKLHLWGMDSRAAFIIVFCGALILASAFSYWVEQPSLRVLRGWRNKKNSRKLISENLPEYT